MSKYKIINIGITPQQYELLREKSFKENKSMGKIVRNSINDMLMSKEASVVADKPQKNTRDGLINARGELNGENY